MLLNSSIENHEFDIGIRLVMSFLKYNKNYLTLPSNQSIVDVLWRHWLKMSEISNDNIMENSSNVIKLTKNYSRIMKCFLAYCKSPKARMAVAFEIIKGFRYQGFFDMSPIKLFFTFELPNTFSIRKQRDLLLIALDRIKMGSTGQPGDELKFLIIELGIMPIIVKHSQSP